VERSRRTPSLMRPIQASGHDRYSLLHNVLSWTLILSCAISTLIEPDVAHAESDSRRPAVAAANGRVESSYDYRHVDRTRSTFNSSPTATATLRIGEADFHTGVAKVVGTLPVTHSLGVRGNVHGRYDLMRQDRDGFGSGTDDTEIVAYGATAEIFWRDPEVGSVTVGSSFDRIDVDRGLDANEFGASLGAAIFFPDLGSGPVDWVLRLDYARQDVSGSGTSGDLDSDIFTVSGGAGWYLTDQSQVVIGARWNRAENDFADVEDFEGFLDVHWLLPTPISMELTLGGSVGVSEYKESPFPSDDRLIYGASVGLTFRFRSAPTLVEIVRAYD
jgi:hypothetical protein